MVELGAGEVLVETCKLFKRLPRAAYTARLLQKVATPSPHIADDIGAYDVWQEV